MTILQPQLALAREPDGEYTLNAVTITPNSCYAAGRAQMGVPPTVRIVAEVLPVLLHVRTRQGPCLQVLTPVRHRIHNLQLGGTSGKTSVLAFVMLNGTVAGSASIRVDDAGTCVNDGPKPVDTADWYAWLNRMPPGPASFHLRGTVHVPTPGYAARLVKAAPQGINPKELILDLAIEQKPGFWPDVVVPLSVQYEEIPAGVDYTGVLIRIPGSDSVHVEVEQVF